MTTPGPGTDFADRCAALCPGFRLLDDPCDPGWIRVVFLQAFRTPADHRGRLRVVADLAAQVARLR